MVQTGEAGEVFFRDRRSRLCSDQTVGVGRVPHDQYLGINKKNTHAYHSLPNEGATAHSK